MKSVPLEVAILYQSHFPKKLLIYYTANILKADLSLKPEEQLGKGIFKKLVHLQNIPYFPTFSLPSFCLPESSLRRESWYVVPYLFC